MDFARIIRSRSLSLFGIASSRQYNRAEPFVNAVLAVLKPCIA